jgi:hypothetical protein
LSMRTVFLIAVIAALRVGVLAGVEITGELKQWHKVTLTVDGPMAKETDTDPNPFTDYRFNAAFRHEASGTEYLIPGYFAADGRAGESSAEAGNKWRAHFVPDRRGTWSYRVQFRRGKLAAVESGNAAAVSGVDGQVGRFEISKSDKSGRDFRGKGRLRYVGKRYLQFAGSSEYFLKFGADSPESLLAYADFDGTEGKSAAAGRQGEAAPAGLHRYEPHLRDWRAGDPTWKDGKGKGLIGALNYLAGEGCNAFSFLTYNAGGDGDNVWPFRARAGKLNYDCSKLDQWQVIFDHAQKLGLYLHFKLQETEMDDGRVGPKRESKDIAEALDGGALGIERKLYLRELIARFGYALALNWNLGEENTQSTEEQRAMASYIQEIDPYDHHIVLHTYPQEQEKVYAPLLGDSSALTGLSLQNNWNVVHERTLAWIKASTATGKPWVVANDEQGPADLGVPADPGYQGFSGQAGSETNSYDVHDIRKLVLWGNLMAGGAGVEYYFGYKLPQNDLGCEDWRSRAQTWRYGRIALDFFRDQKIPFWEMENADEIAGNLKGDNSVFCLAKGQELFLVYVPKGGKANLVDLPKAPDGYVMSWFNPRDGGAPRQVTRELHASGKVTLGAPTDIEEDWLLILRQN